MTGSRNESQSRNCENTGISLIRAVGAVVKERRAAIYSRRTRPQC